MDVRTGISRRIDKKQGQGRCGAHGKELGCRIVLTSQPGRKRPDY